MSLPLAILHHYSDVEKVEMVVFYYPVQNPHSLPITHKIRPGLGPRAQKDSRPPSSCLPSIQLSFTTAGPPTHSASSLLLTLPSTGCTFADRLCVVSFLRSLASLEDPSPSPPVTLLHSLLAVSSSRL